MQSSCYVITARFDKARLARLKKDFRVRVKTWCVHENQCSGIRPLISISKPLTFVDYAKVSLFQLMLGIIEREGKFATCNKVKFIGACGIGHLVVPARWDIYNSQRRTKFMVCRVITDLETVKCYGLDGIVPDNHILISQSQLPLFIPTSAWVQGEPCLATAQARLCHLLRLQELIEFRIGEA